MTKQQAALETEHKEPDQKQRKQTLGQKVLFYGIGVVFVCAVITSLRYMDNRKFYNKVYSTGPRFEASKATFPFGRIWYDRWEDGRERVIEYSRFDLGHTVSNTGRARPNEDFVYKIHIEPFFGPEQTLTRDKDYEANKPLFNSMDELLLEMRARCKPKE